MRLRFHPAMKLRGLLSFAICLSKAMIQGPIRRQKREEGLTLQEAQAWVGLGFKVSVSS